MSALFCQNILLHRLVEAEIGNQPLEQQVFFLTLPRMIEFRRLSSALSLAQGLKGGIGNIQLAINIRHGRIQFGLFRGKDNLLFAES